MIYYYYSLVHNTYLPINGIHSLKCGKGGDATRRIFVIRRISDSQRVQERNGKEK